MDHRTSSTERNGWARAAAIAVIAGLGLLSGGCYAVTPGPYAYAGGGPPPPPDALTSAAGQFSQSFQCPIDRVTASFEAVAPNPPAPDVAADPARLAMYNQQIAAELALLRMVSAAGCGHAAMFRCAVRDTRHHGELAVCAMIERGALGVAILRTTRSIDRVEPGGLGERLGFRPGDVLVALDRQPITDTTDCIRQINDPRSPGHVITVQRGVSLVDISVPRLPQ